jgi:hypothetical protein
MSKCQVITWYLCCNSFVVYVYLVTYEIRSTKFMETRKLHSIVGVLYVGILLVFCIKSCNCLVVTKFDLTLLRSVGFYA